MTKILSDRLSIHFKFTIKNHHQLKINVSQIVYTLNIHYIIMFSSYIFTFVLCCVALYQCVADTPQHCDYILHLDKYAIRLNRNVFTIIKSLAFFPVYQCRFLNVNSIAICDRLHRISSLNRIDV